jgi:hypothetical protein
MWLVKQKVIFSILILNRGEEIWFCGDGKYETILGSGWGGRLRADHEIGRSVHHIPNLLERPKEQQTVCPFYPRRQFARLPML